MHLRVQIKHEQEVRPDMRTWMWELTNKVFGKVGRTEGEENGRKILSVN